MKLLKISEEKHPAGKLLSAALVAYENYEKTYIFFFTRNHKDHKFRRIHCQISFDQALSESKFTEAPQELTSCLKEASNHLASKGQLNPLKAKNNVNLFDQDFNKEKMFHLVTGLLVDDYISNNLLSIKENGAHFQAEFKKTLIRD